MAHGPEVKPGDAEVLVRHGFKMNTAYMQVPWCGGCRWWLRITEKSGECRMLGLSDGEQMNQAAKARILPESLVYEIEDAEFRTQADFGCVQ